MRASKKTRPVLTYMSLAATVFKSSNLQHCAASTELSESEPRTRRTATAPAAKCAAVVAASA